jgi:hypothetical protein
MPTDIVLVLMRKAQAEKQALKEDLAALITSCLWVTLGLVLTVLISKYGFDPALAQSSVVNG